MYVESDVRGVGPGKWIRRAARVCSRSRVTHFFTSILPEHGDLTSARQTDVQFARPAKRNSIRACEGERRKERIAVKLFQIRRRRVGQRQPVDHTIQGAILSSHRYVNILIVLIEANSVHAERHIDITGQTWISEPCGRRA